MRFIVHVLNPETVTQCPHCKSKDGTGTHGGCYKCGKVKFTKDGKRLNWKDRMEAA